MTDNKADDVPLHIQDRPSLRAYATLPDLWLEIATAADAAGDAAHVEAVVARQPIKAGVLFGPLTGPEVAPNEKGKHCDLDACWPVFNAHGINRYLACADATMCSWMSLVKRAVFTKQRNLHLVQKDGGLYYTTIRDICEREELCYYYSDGYRQMMRKHLPKVVIPRLLKSTIKSLPDSKDSSESQHYSVDENADFVFPMMEDFDVISEPSWTLADRLTQPSDYAKGCLSTASVGKVHRHSSTAAIAKIEKELKQTQLKLNRCPHHPSAYKWHQVTEALVKQLSQLHKEGSMAGKYPHQVVIVFPPNENLEYSTKHIRFGSNDEKVLPTGKRMKTIVFAEPLPEGIDEASLLLSICKQTVADSVLYKCALCPYNNTAHNAVKRHVIQHTKHRPYICVQCGDSFQSSNALTQHKKIHRPRERSFLCKHCGKGFYVATKLRQHEKIHAKNREQFHCRLCKKAFFTRAKLSQHMKEVHFNVRNHQCEICGKRFTQKHVLDKHVQKIHVRRKGGG